MADRPFAPFNNDNSSHLFMVYTKKYIVTSRNSFGCKKYFKKR